KQITEFNEIEEANQLLTRLHQDIELKETQIEAINSQLDQQTLAYAKLREETAKQCESHWKSERDSYKEQIRQHAKTICVMEDRLIELSKQLDESKSELAKLKLSNT
ncbi:unnamed protein product, partial [Schistosoma turkestanicum]